jgi:hypothetical protein
MPLPPVNATPEQIAALGWAKEAVYENVTVIKGRVLYQKVRWVVGKIGTHGICTRCGNSENVYLHVMPTGVYKTCLGAFCGVTTGPLPIDEDGKQVAEVLEERTISENEAFEILNRTKAPIPLGLRSRMRGGGR